MISVSQNDNGNYCKDPAELAVIDEEGSPIGLYPCVPSTAAISIVHADAILTLALPLDITMPVTAYSAHNRRRTRHSLQ